MLDRRDILKLSAATVAGAVMRIPGIAGMAPRTTLSRIVFDSRLHVARVFAAQFAHVPASVIDDDVARLWYGDLRECLRANRAPFAGLTDRAALFCLEELARDVHMRVVLRFDMALDGRAEARRINHFDVTAPRDGSAQKLTGPFAPENRVMPVSWIIA